ncbi:MAG TPA: flagellar motor stator protein MotA [Oligoflexia bacterium]|nr:flagellar motor stator protein MotA [Oligoflexia bacterium]HMP49759.1 flagellar motor stator protein MotA [Oligoflexia bacterium]
MNFIVSFIVVSASVFGGFAMAHGPFEVLVQPSEYVVIGGAALGALIGYAPFPVFVKIVKTIPRVFKGSGISKGTYLELMGLLLTIFNVIRKEGVLGIEKDLADPHHSERFNKYPKIANNHHAMDLLVGALRLFVDGVVNAFDLDKLLETEIDTHHKEVASIPALLNKVGDAMPGLGIVAAVLGIIITMQHIDGPPSEIGHHVAAALVGTFLGILFAYGYIQPLASSIEMMQHEEHVLFNAIRAALVSFAGGSPPAVALEFARKSIEGDVRPSAEEMEEINQAVRKG